MGQKADAAVRPLVTVLLDDPADEAWARILVDALDVEASIERPQARALGPAHLFVDLRSMAGAIDAPIGTWTLVDGDGETAPSLGRQAFLRGDRVVPIRLVALHVAAAARFIDEGCFPLVPHSWRAAQRRLLRAAADLVSVALRRHANGDIVEGVCVALPPPQPAPAALRMRLAGMRNLGRRLAAEAQEDEWAVGIVERPAAEMIRHLDPAEVRWLPPPARGFVADPMARPSARPETGEAFELLAEIYDFRERLGRIAAVDPAGVEDPVEVLRQPSHLSYPQLIEEGEAVWCVPEMGAARRVQLFRADPFPTHWVPDAVLLDDFPAVDPTFWRGPDRWWLFTGRLDAERDAKLFIFHAPDLRGPWTPHALNPVRADIRGGRMAGPLIETRNRLYRVGQDSSVAYGGAVVVHEILDLAPERYRERVIGRLDPDPVGPYPHGLHTVCAAGGWTLVDGKRHRRSLRPLWALVRGRLGLA